MKRQNLHALSPAPRTLPKYTTGIRGFDQITGGGLPRGRLNLLRGGPSSRKTVVSKQFLVRGAQVTTRYLRVVNDGGSLQGRNEYARAVGFWSDRAALPGTCA